MIKEGTEIFVEVDRWGTIMSMETNNFTETKQSKNVHKQTRKQNFFGVKLNCRVMATFGT